MLHLRVYLLLGLVSTTGQVAAAHKIKVFASQHTAPKAGGKSTVAGQTELDGLELDHTKVNDAGLVHLKGMTKLRPLKLGHTSITDAGLKNLEGLTNLTTLDLFKTIATADGYAAHRKSLRETGITGD